MKAFSVLFGRALINDCHSLLSFALLRLHPRRTVHGLPDFPGRERDRAAGVHHGGARRAAGERDSARIEEAPLLR